ncbi:MAG: WD40 repeat domain-containing protein [Chthoniobacter sp.]
MKLTLAHDYKLPTGTLGLAITPDGSRAFATCIDGTLHTVDLASGTSEVFDGTHGSYASGCALLPDGRTVITGGYDGLLLWHDVETRHCWRRVQAHRFWNWQLALSPDGSRLATVTGQYVPGGWKYEPAPETESSVKVFDTMSGDLFASFSHTPPVMSCAFTPDGQHVAAANIMGEVRVWSLQPGGDGKPVAQFTSPDFTCWGTIKTHHFCGGIYGLSFSPDGSVLLCCGMGPMSDPMAGNGKMTWQRWNWQKGERIDQIKDGQHGFGLMESVTWHPSGTHFVMAGRQAQGTWNIALFSAADGSLVHSVDTKKRITHAQFTADGQSLIVSGATGQGPRKNGGWEPWGRVQVYKVEA